MLDVARKFSPLISLHISEETIQDSRHRLLTACSLRKNGKNIAKLISRKKYFHPLLIQPELCRNHPLRLPKITNDTFDQISTRAHMSDLISMGSIKYWSRT